MEGVYMRGVLYKAKRLDNGEWVEGYLIELGKHSFSESKRFGIIDKAIPCGFNSVVYNIEIMEIDPETVCQQTGLPDKNDAMIFENDKIVEVKSGMSGIVKFSLYDGKHYGFHIVWNGLCNYRNDIYYWANNNLIEVTGNVYDNPEVLEAK